MTETSPLAQVVGDPEADQATADYVGADYYCRIAQDGVVAAKKVLGGRGG
jgi:hypothetical protein